MLDILQKGEEGTQCRPRPLPRPPCHLLQGDLNPGGTHCF